MKTLPEHPTELDADSRAILRHFAGDPSGWREMDNRYRDDVRRHVIFWTGRARADLADEIAQSAMMKTWERLDHFRLGTCFRAWLLVIATRQMWKELRKIERGGLEFSDYDRKTGVAGSERSPDTLVDRARALAAFLALPQTQRDAFSLREIDELSLEEAARQLGCSQSAVSLRVKAAKKAMEKFGAKKA